MAHNTREGKIYDQPPVGRTMVVEHEHNFQNVVRNPLVYCRICKNINLHPTVRCKNPLTFYTESKNRKSNDFGMVMCTACPRKKKTKQNKTKQTKTRTKKKTKQNKTKQKQNLDECCAFLYINFVLKKDCISK